MKVLAAICCLVIGASAQVGPSGIVNPDGTLVQFTAEQANNIASIGPSGIVTKDGRNMQLPAGQTSFSASDIPTPIAKAAAPLPDIKAGGLVGASGIVYENGNTQFTREQAENIVVAGPSGIVTKDGRNIQFRTKRALIGPSGIVNPDGTFVQFTAEQASNIASIGPSGIVTKDGRNMQLPAGHTSFSAADIPTPTTKAASPLPKLKAGGLVGASGIVYKDGNTQFTREQADNIVVAGPSGIVTKDGRNIQFRTKRPLIGPSGIVNSDGTFVQFTAEQASNIASIGPSGIVTKDGRNMQLPAGKVSFSAADIPAPVAKAYTPLPNLKAGGLVGASGIVYKYGNTQFTREQAENIVVAGPSGIVTKDGRNIQFRTKRALIGPSGIVNSDGTFVQFTAEQASNIASIGPSGIVTKDGKNMQLPAGKVSFSAADIPTPVAKAYTSLPELRAGGLIGASGIVYANGNMQFTREQAENIVVVGPSGVVTKDGRNVQFRTKRALIGPSGIILADGTPVQFRAEEIAVRSGLTDEENLNAVVIGPSGIVNRDGKNTQLKAPDAPTVLLEGPSGKVMSDGSLIQKIAKRSAGYVSTAGNIGHSGILRADGSTDLFSHDFAHNIVLIGPSGIVTKDGSNAQLTSDLHRV